MMQDIYTACRRARGRNPCGDLSGLSRQRQLPGDDFQRDIVINDINSDSRPCPYRSCDRQLPYFGKSDRMAKQLAETLR